MKGFATMRDLNNVLSSGKNKRQPIGSSQKKVVLKKQKYKCAKCGKPLQMSIHFDHIKPISKGGKSTTDNLRALCPTCHGDRHIEDTAKELNKKRKTKQSFPWEMT